MPPKKANYLPLIFIPIIIILCFGLWWVNKLSLPWIKVTSETGVFDMRDIDFKNTFAEPERSGEYIPGELLTPEEFAARDDILVGSVPVETRVSTMRVRLLVPNGVIYGIGGYAPNYASSVYVNGEWIYNQGKPGLILEDEESSEAYRLISVQPRDGVIEIVVQTSSFANIDTTQGMGLLVGEFENLRIYYTRMIAQDIIVMSAYILLALISLLLFLVLTDYKATGWLSLLSLVWAVRVGLKSRKILLTLFPVHTWNFVFKTEIITSPLTIILLALILHSIFTGALPKWLRAIIIGVSVIMALAVVFLPWPTFLGHSHWSNSIMYWSLAVILLPILISIRRTKPTLSQIIILAGMGLVVFSFIWDEQYFGNLRLPFAITQPSMLVFTMFMLISTMLETMRKAVRREVELVQKVRMQETELLETRIAIMLSQIQPHFIYNSLAAIQRLCTKDPKLAEETVIEFTTYLRGNLDSLSNNKPIPFEKELQHLESYLSIEKKRFGERLNIVYEISARNFYLPTLTLQPIAENAIRHGVTKRDKGGTVTIRTDETDTDIVLTVIDDGVGFDSSRMAVESLRNSHIGEQDAKLLTSLSGKYEDERQHTGIENVRSRLTTMYNGTLTVKSERDIGTTVVIKIPKGED